ncbi:MAG: immunoglobulin domain-containing protein [Bacteroidetes bacterium]|nr:immunoglobulin domain-containing protein [Bacteroidota bacterium]
MPLGANTSDCYLANLDSLGNLLWTRIIGGSGEESGQSIVQCNDGGLLVVGSSSSYNSNTDVHLIKLEINGTTCGNFTSNGAIISGGVATTLSNYTTSSVNINNVNGPINSYNGGTIFDICACTFPSASVTAQSLIICSGSNTTLSTNATTGNNYQWLRNGVVIQGANSSSYGATLSGIYNCIQSNSCGADTSNNITLTVKGLPSASISTSGSTTFCAGDSILLNGPITNNRSYQWMRNGINIPNAIAPNFFVTQSGAYRLLITNTNTGCSKKGNIISTSLTPLPSATITPLGPTTFCAGNNVTLQANPGVGYSYQWRKNGSAISGATTINYNATTAGKYKVDVTNGNGCITKSSNVVVSVPCREGDNEDETSVQIYPNPTSGIFKLEFQYELLQ